MNKFEDWLNRHLVIENPTENPQPSTSGLPLGRPSSTFEQSSLRTRKRKIGKVVGDNSLKELLLATEVKLRKSGGRDAANMLKELVISPKRATTIKKVYQKNRSDAPISKILYSPEEALALIVSTKLTKAQYMLIRQGALQKSVKMYPSYHQVLQAKQSCYPLGVRVSDTSAEIDLQSMMDFTIKRLFMTLSDEQTRFLSENNVEALQYTVKWGCDGCGGLSRYKQLGSHGSVVDDSSVLASSFVPLQLSCVEEGNPSTILWRNPRTSSPRFCRPIRFRFIKETADELVSEISHIENQIRQLVPTQVEVCGKPIKVFSNFLLTMIDGKVCNALAYNACSQKCFICGATSKQMNNLTLNLPINEETTSWGLSPLHAYIRFMECVLHISYRLEVPKWNVRMTNEEKAVVNSKNSRS